MRKYSVLGMFIGMTVVVVYAITRMDLNKYLHDRNTVRDWYRGVRDIVVGWFTKTPTTQV